MASEPSVFKENDLFIQQMDDLEIEVKPDLSSKEQGILANKLAVSIRLYRATTGYYKVMLKAQKIKNTQGTELPADLDEYERKVIGETMESVTSENIEKAWDARYDAAAQLGLCITQVKAHGMVHPGQEVFRQLRECKEERQSLSDQLLEYKRTHILPMNK